MLRRSLPRLPATLSAALLLPLALSACGGTVNRGLDSVHQPVVSRTDYVFDVAEGSAGLQPGERARLAGWLGSLRLRYGDKVAVDDPAGSGRARDAVAAEVARFGLLLADAAPVTSAPVAPGTARVVVSRSVAHVPNCPDFSRVSGTEFNSNTSSNFGCATNGDLAMMIADPNDLVRGEPGSGTADPANITRAIDAYRKAAPSGGGGATVGGGGGATGGSK